MDLPSTDSSLWAPSEASWTISSKLSVTKELHAATSRIAPKTSPSLITDQDPRRGVPFRVAATENIRPGTRGKRGSLDPVRRRATPPPPRLAAARRRPRRLRCLLETLQLDGEGGLFENVLRRTHSMYYDFVSSYFTLAVALHGLFRFLI